MSWCQPQPFRNINELHPLVVCGWTRSGPGQSKCCTWVRSPPRDTKNPLIRSKRNLNFSSEEATTPKIEDSRPKFSCQGREVNAIWFSFILAICFTPMNLAKSQRLVSLLQIYWLSLNFDFQELASAFVWSCMYVTRVTLIMRFLCDTHFALKPTLAWEIYSILDFYFERIVWVIQA